MKFHKSIESISIFQYYKLFETGDLRYLIYLDRYELHDLPEIKDYSELNKAYDLFFSKLNNVDTEEQILKGEVLKTFSQYIDNDKFQKHHFAFTKYLKFLSKKDISFKYDNQVWHDVLEFYGYLKNKLGSEIYMQRVFIFLNLQFEQEEIFDFYKNIAEIKKAGYTLDIYLDSWALYLGILESLKDAFNRNKQKNKQS